MVTVHKWGDRRLAAGVAGPPVAAVSPEKSGTAAMVAGTAVAVERLHRCRPAGVRGNGWIVGILGGLRMSSRRQRTNRECSGGKGSNSCSHFGVPIRPDIGKITVRRPLQPRKRCE